MPGPMFDNNAPAQVPSGGTGTSLMDSLGGAIAAANAQVEAAAKQVQNTPMYSKSSAPAPTMLVPSLKGQLFGGASSNNLANKQVTTPGGARSKAIGQLAGLGAQTVGRFMQHKEAEKTQALAIDIHKSLELQQGIDEAQQILKQDPNNAEAKATLQKNSTLLTALLNGKSGKDIAKAYGVTFGDEAKEMSPEKKQDSMHYKAMTDAMKQKKQDDEKAKATDPSRMNQFEAGQAARMTPNPQYDAAFKQYTAVQKQADDLTKTYTTLAGQMARADATSHAADQRLEATKIGQEGANARTDATNQTRVEIADAKIKADMAKAKEEHQFRLSEIATNHAARLKEITAAKNAQTQANMGKDWFNETATMLDKTQTEMDNLTKTAANQNTSAEDKKAIQQKIEDIKAERTQLFKDADTAKMYMFQDPDAVGVHDLTNPSNLSKQ